MTTKTKTKPPEKVIPQDDKVNINVDGSLDHIESIRPVIAELERYVIWATEGVHDFEINLDDHKVTITVQTRGRAKKYAHFAAERWSTKEGSIAHEIAMSAEDLKRDPYEVLGTLHHELVHAVAHVKGIKDMAEGGGQRHNKQFKALAEEYGLVFQILDEEDTEPRPHKTYGWAFTELSEELRHEIETEFQPNLEVFNLFRTLAPPRQTQATKMKKYQCGCQPKPFIIRSAKDVKATCDICGLSFQKDETSEV